MKKRFQAIQKSNHDFFQGETVKSVFSSFIMKAAMLAGILFTSLLSCKRDPTFSNDNGLAKNSLSSVTAASSTKRIDNLFFGINAWMHTTPCSPYGELSSLWSEVTNSGARFIRVGGISYDKCLNFETQFNTSNIITEILANGLTPIVQLSYYDPASNPAAPSVWTDPAAAATHLINNVVIPLYIQGVRYYSVGNEPDNNNDYNTPNNVALPGQPPHYQNTAAGIYDYILAISQAIDAIEPLYPGIKLFGPELSYFNESLISDLTGQYNILPYIDYFTVHYYAFGDEGATTNPDFPDATRDNIIKVLRQGDGVVYKRNSTTEIVNSLEYKLNYLLKKISDYPVKIAITEANLCYENYDNDYDIEGVEYMNGADLVHVYGTNSFIAGQFWAEMMAVCMSKGVDFIHFWSVKEGGVAPYNKNIGYINSATDHRNSTYYHFQMMAQHFKGNFKWGAVSGIPSKVKAFASNGPTEIAVLVMNQEEGGNVPIAVRLNNTVVPGGGVDINIAMGLNKTHNDVISGEETLLILYDKITGTKTTLRYNIQNNIDNLPPQ